MRIRQTLPAAGDLTQICDYVEKRGSPVAARRVALSIYEGIVSCCLSRGQDVVEILRTLHGAQEWP